MRWFRSRLALTVALVLIAASAAAQSDALPDSLAKAALAEQVPSAFAPVDFTVDDYEVVRVGGDDEGVLVRLEPESLRWVRAGKLVVVPRASLYVEARGAEAATVAHAGFTHPLVAGTGGVRGTVPVALLSTQDASIVVDTRRGGAQHQASFAVRVRPRPKHPSRIAFDTSCSSYGLSVQAGQVPDDSFLYVGCRLVRTDQRARTVPTLELYVLWDNVGAAVTLDGVEVRATSPSLWLYRVTSAPGTLRFGARGKQVTLSYRLPEVLHAGFVGAGLGPYYYAYEHADESIEAPVPLVTLYAGYAFDALTRIVYFNATALHRRGYSDQGLYLWFEQFRVFDERVSMNLLLGANLLVYRRSDTWVTRINAPQGIEFIVRDFVGVDRNLTVGAFLYPDIYGSAYYNAWIRWGSPRFFGEVNFLDWREPHSSGATETQSLGVTFGMPLFRFL